MDNGTVKDINVNCKGCAISVASGSMLAEYIKGKPLDEVKKIADVVKKMLKGEEFDLSEDLDNEELGDIDSLKGVRKFPVRIKCALLAWMTLIEGLKNYEDGKKGHNPTSTEKDGE
jgi:nitrogen fixation NifU-like protein